ncbi:MAG TPA: alkaline phosphatase family protein [Kofleriaceae bacterium]
MKGTLPRDSLGDYPSFKDTVKHVILVLRENRSFDHYLGAYERSQHRALGSDAQNTNPDPSTGHNVARYHTGQYCTAGGNPDHEWNAAHLAFDNGKLDGFVAASNTDDQNRGGCIAMSYFDRSDLPFYYWLADNFAISESYFASLLGPTMANISYYYNATACGTTENIETTASATLSRVPYLNGCPAGSSIFDLLAAHGIPAQVYNDSPGKLDSAAVGLTHYDPTNVRSIQDFRDDVTAEDAGNGTLADVVFLEPNYGHLNFVPGSKPQNDEHPPSNIQDGQYFVYDIVKTLLAHPRVFSHTVVFISWDENGGFYDHVVPPPACEPDGYRPSDFDLKRYGFRVPFFAVSPLARARFASQYTADHTSVLRFIEAWKDLPALTARDANAWPLLDMFDFSAPARDPSSFTPLSEPPVKPCPGPGAQ